MHQQSTAYNLDSDPVSEFQSAMAGAGIITDEIPIADGHKHRIKTDSDKNGKSSAEYVLYGDGVPSGRFWSYKLDIDETWSLKSYKEFTPQQRADYAKQMAHAKEERKKAQAITHKEARGEAERLWNEAKPETGNHKYLRDKGVQAFRIRSNGENLLIPLRDSGGTLHSIQTIDTHGKKLFLSGGAIQGHYFGIGKPNGKVVVAEGYSTAATIHEATGHAVAVAFNAGNLTPVAKALRERFPDIEIIIAGDNDTQTKGNPGKSKATEAALAVNGRVIIPEFINTESNPTDFNDLAVLEGQEQVKKFIDSAQTTNKPKETLTTSQELILKISELAQLSTLEYELVRKNEAGALDIRVDVLDKAVSEAKGGPDAKEGPGRAISLYEPEPWDSPVNGAEVLDEAYNVIMRHMVIRKEDAIACVLWAVHAHMYDIFDHTPRLLITAPDAECGKTLLMCHMVGSLVTRPQPVELMKAAPFFRLVESLKPTLLIDEMDAFIKDDSDLLAAVNGGWEPHGGVPRCVGEDNEVRVFSTHCPVVMAGVELNKKLPVTTITRSIVISLERAAYEDISDEDIYNAKQHKQALINIGRKIARWSLDHRDKVSEIAPCLPPKTRNRLADKWTSLFKIANAVGGDWPKHAKTALFGQVDMSEPSKAMMLLEDIREIMEPGEDRISTKDMISRLCNMEDAPWADYNFRASDRENRRISDRQVSNLLKKYNIRPKNIRGESVLKGYDLAALQNAWNRYLPSVDTPNLAATPLQSNNHKALRQSTNATKGDDVADKNPTKPALNKECSVVADRNRGTGGHGCIPHEKTQEVTILIESILDELGKPITVDMVLGELAPDDYQYLINDHNYARGFVKTLSERLAT